MHVLNLTDGTTTISLTTNGVMLRSYTPTAPQGNQPITESIDLMVYGASTAAMQTKINDIERMLVAAKRRATTSAGARVYLQFQPINDAVTWRSEVVSGLLMLDNKALTVFGQAQMRVTLILTRAPYWEGAEVELQLSTSNQAAATGGRTIRNHDDSGTGDDNWVQIDAAQVGGVLPAPARVAMTNTTGSAQAYTKVWMATNAFSDPANFVHIIEGESRSGIGTVTADANCSNGSRLDVSLGVGVGGSIYFAISAAQLQRTQGRRFRLLARFATNSGKPTITPRLTDDTTNVPLWVGESVIIETQGQHIADLGTVSLPVGGWGTNYGGVTLALGCRGAMNAQLDFVQLTPLDSYRYVELFGYAVANNAALVDDGIDERTYVLTSGAAYPYAVPRGAPLLIYPNTTQRIIFLHQTSTAAPIANAFSVRVYYRPRRLTL